MTGLKAGVIGGGWFSKIHCNVIAVAALAAGKHVLLENRWRRRWRSANKSVRRRGTPTPT